VAVSLAIIDNPGREVTGIKGFERGRDSGGGSKALIEVGRSIRSDEGVSAMQVAEDTCVDST
jgi:hypothetical protein